jgi:hypothetical protein
MNRWILASFIALATLLHSPCAVLADTLDSERLLRAETFWDNQDWDWYQEHIPLFECPDRDLQTTYYYRWELITKHLTYGSPNSGYSFTEFIDRPFWSGAYGAISCPAGHQIYESRWLRSPRIARDYTRYWFRTAGAQPRNYSTWLADSLWALHQVHPDDRFAIDLLPDLQRNHEGWEKRHYVPDVGLYWQTGHDDGMEFNINSRQTKDILRGAPSYRPTFNAYMWADARAIARVARLANQPDVAQRYEQQAAAIKTRLQDRLWDQKRQFFFPAYRDDEERDGHRVKKLTLTYETGQFAGSPHGRELIGYVPWQFNLPDADRGYEQAWKFLMDREYFAAAYGPTTVERRDPMFLLQKSCCWWSGQSWPYATTQTLKALANLLQGYEQSVISRRDYVELLTTYAKTHRKDGRPYLAEACHPDTGSFEGHDGYNHSEHYFHSGYCDLIITGLVGIRPSDDEQLTIDPLAPSTWDYFALDRLPYRGHQITVLWDRTGERYKQGVGLRVLVDNKPVAQSAELKKLTITLPRVSERAAATPDPRVVDVNFAVNNDGYYYPRLTTSSAAPGFPPSKLIDGNYWYLRHPPNRWTTEGSNAKQDWVEVDFGMPRTLHTVKLYPLDDGPQLATPERIDLEIWTSDRWVALSDAQQQPTKPTGHRANTWRFTPREVSKLRVTLTHRAGAASGLSEIEAWGPATLPVEPAPGPVGNLAFNRGDKPFPRVSASHTSRFDKLTMANDGVTSFNPSPHNRWTSYESKESSDWLEVDFGGEKSISRIELALYDDRGGVQAPQSMKVQFLQNDVWRDVVNPQSKPAQPTGGLWNEIRFDSVKSDKVRVIFTHRGQSRSGISEILVWEK